MRLSSVVIDHRLQRAEHSLRRLRKIEGDTMKGSGGTEGGLSLFFIGLGLSGLALYLFFDSVFATTMVGVFSRMMGRGGQGGMWATTSMGLLFVPFLIAVIALFYDSRMKWAWWLLYFAVAVIAIEILSSIRFELRMKMTHLLGLMVLFAAGVGLILRSYRDASTSIGGKDKPPTES